MIDLKNYKVQLRGLARVREFKAFSIEDAAQQWAAVMPLSAWANGDLSIVVTAPNGVMLELCVKAKLEFTIT